MKETKFPINEGDYDSDTISNYDKKTRFYIRFIFRRFRQ